MILITGGAYQGKTDFALNTLKIAEESILNGFHAHMKEWLLSGGEPDELTDKILADKNIQAVISDDIGMGIVPADKFERLWREQTGRALCRLSRNADEVYRVSCGMAVKIKG